MIHDMWKILEDMGLLAHQNKEELMKNAEQAHESLETYLLSNKLITSQDLAKAYAKNYSLPFIEFVTEEMADPELLAKVQFNFLRQNIIMPIMLAGKITILVVDPLNLASIDELSMLLAKDAPIALATAGTIIDGINRYYPLEGAKKMMEDLEEDTNILENGLDLGQIEDQDILNAGAQAPVVKLVNHILFQAVKRGASDIHIEPFEKDVAVRYRVDGIMYLAFSPPKRIQGALISRLKIMANLNIAEKRMPQDGRIEIKVSDKFFDIRVSVLPVMHGERIVMRLLDKSKAFASLEDLGLSEHNAKIIKDVIQKPNGIIFVSGPTGSGKTTTLYSIVSRLNSPDVNIITVEDPVEYQITGINQVQVQNKIGFTFASALRSILRQDPDIVMIGETRDVETAQIAVQAALTGHLVLSTIHTNNAPATITRLIDMGVEPFLISSSVLAVIAQRLVRKLCENCKEQYTPTAEMIHSIGMTSPHAKTVTFYKPVGCDKCLGIGYKGRMPVFEIMVMSNALARLVIEKADANVLRAQAQHDGMKLLIQDGAWKIELGLTTIEEVLSVATLQEDTEL
ncbi:type II secretion system ATPase GspE [Candidatus Chromulinivorax destructor]|uniref:protein-secreting ATPase n=1 Tax=Candidatus Chromulinivorax destructor TaxID=2066483 RepID=A0A345ZBL0_9BACT|nr:type II secretion system ATPase GspE [Candidatus Chromulinivorax destructor]AXK60677.1 type II secretion system protein GspE [Candidatus Chromulinivorax destructor]